VIFEAGRLGLRQAGVEPPGKLFAGESVAFDRDVFVEARQHRIHVEVQNLENSLKTFGPHVFGKVLCAVVSSGPDVMIFLNTYFRRKIWQQICVLDSKQC
jgi:hypothetical protein